MFEKLMTTMLEIHELLSTDLSLTGWISIATAVVCAFFMLITFRVQVARVRRLVEHDDETPIPVEGYPSVSVVVFSQGDSANLRVLLPQILEQDYPSALEVIVVNDEKSADTTDVISELELRYRNLYMTFAPELSRNLSRKKLSITLGMKAARHEAVILTCGNCRVESPIWLRLMMRHFIEGKEVVLGYSLPAVVDIDNFEGCASAARMSRMLAFDQEWTLVRNLGSAAGGVPVVGDGYNLAYSRRLFFENKGFSRSLNLNYGDDDIFVSEIANERNTAVEISPDSRVLAVESRPEYMYGVNKVRHMFTSRFVRRGAFRLMGLYCMMSWLLSVSAVVASVTSLPSLLGLIAALVAVLGTAIPCMVAWRKAGRALGLPRQALLTQPFLMLWHPFFNLKYKRKLRKVIAEQYTSGQKL